MNLQNILTKFGQDIGVGPLNFDERDAFYLRFNQTNVVVEHVESAGAVFIYSVISDLPDVDSQKLYSVLLDANLFGQGSGFASFARNASTGEILLISRLATEDLSYEKFVFTTEDFLASLEKSKSFVENAFNARNTSPLQQNFHLKNPYA